ncbi:ribosome hibernation-promoting factor, HPF/YfiA family [Pediococcus argentinicus]|uniref:Ribosome hibernation promoting factor n=1 Tax=Pediococcus argentinicus TaxID=480391 RepID=A0A0R2NIZ9_9LACO|nr:ribosome-associated translation inhibitor RaiA [Pediococcus argentinicus]KRO25752.1 SSU ribosomal protein S30P sigma 54 modulation protein [Pediococcus argentinicus]NKZ21918.1 ribosome-associated translation inhibitor RaiA [Pediococcus argentinicus]GEP19087.1 ribosomal subunit interface protein [Pediococcus argentinicus]
MLDFNVRGENIEVTDAIRDYVQKRIGKVEKYFDEGANPKAHVNLKVYQDKTAKVEVTIPLPYLVLRAEETSPDLYASIDLVTDKLERQLRKYKTKINRKSREKGFKGVEVPAADLTVDADGNDEDNASKFDIVRTKQVSLKPMDSEEAILQMDMLGHNFFIYEDAETESVNIVYKRRDGRYGLIESDDE